MKKKVLFIAAIAVGLLTTNQAEAQDFKASEGHHNIEMNFAPMGGAPISISKIKYRQFIADDMALRLGVSISSSSRKADPTKYSDDNEYQNKDSEFGLSLSPGVEKHFGGTDRLSPYIGGEINFTMLKNKNISFDDDFNGKVYEVTEKNGNIGVGLNLLLGTDWYFTKNMYMGTEIGFGFLFVSDSKTKRSTEEPGIKDVEIEHGSSFQLGPNFQSGIRLGFLF